MKILQMTTWLVGGRAVGDVLSFVFYIALARRFGESGVGDYSFAFALAALFGLGVEFGLRPLITREVARDPERARPYAMTLFAVQAGLGLLLGAGLIGLALAGGYSPDVRALLILAYLGIALRSIGVSFVAYLEAVEAMDKSALLEVIGKLAVAAVGLFFVLGGFPLTTVMAAHVVGGVVYLVMAVIWARSRFGSLLGRFDPQLARSTLIAALPFLGATALYELYTRIDVLMLHSLIGEAETGRYAVAMRLATAPVVLANLTGFAIYPHLSRNDPGGARLFLRSLKWLGMIGMAGALVLLTAGDSLLLVLFGADFALSADIVRWLAILLFVQFVGVPYWRFLYAANRERGVLLLQGLSLGLNVLLNALLIPRWGAYGAAGASIASNILLTGSFQWACASLVPAPYARMSVRLLAAGGFGAGVGISMQAVLPWYVVAPATLVAFAAAASLMRIFTARDYQALMAAIWGLAPSKSADARV